MEWNLHVLSNVPLMFEGGGLLFVFKRLFVGIGLVVDEGWKFGLGNLRLQVDGELVLAG